MFTGEKYFLGFFAFAVDFQYFFAKADEMQEGQILRSAVRGFFAGMGVTAAGTLLLLGEGKTTFALRLAAACTNRKPFPHMAVHEPFNVIYQTALPSQPNSFPITWI